MQNSVKKVLIVGSSAKEYALAKKMSEYGLDIIVAPGNKRIEELVKCVDIREDKPSELLEFVLENAVDFTIACSEKAIMSDIANLFQQNNQLIFSPSAKSAEITFSRAAIKKSFYKLKIKTPHFGIYDKLQNAIEYLKKAPMPQVIYSDKSFENGDRLVCNSYSIAKIFTEDLFLKGADKVVFEDYIFGHEFTFYVITDGYHAVPICSVANYKFIEDGDGGILTQGVGAYVPDYKISDEIEKNIMNNVVARILESQQKKNHSYMGILGVECVLDDDGSIAILNLKHFLSEHDAQTVLSVIDENLLNIFEACVMGTFEDYSEIKLSDNSSVSCVVSSRSEGKIIEGLDYVESDITFFGINKNKYMEYETISGRNFVITKTAKTLSRARTQLYEDLNSIKFEGIKFRTDICKQVENF